MNMIKITDVPRMAIQIMMISGPPWRIISMMLICSLPPSAARTGAAAERSINRTKGMVFRSAGWVCFMGESRDEDFFAFQSRCTLGGRGGGFRVVVENVCHEQVVL